MYLCSRYVQTPSSLLHFRRGKIYASLISMIALRFHRKSMVLERTDEAHMCNYNRRKGDASKVSILRVQGFTLSLFKSHFPPAGTCSYNIGLIKRTHIFMFSMFLSIHQNALFRSKNDDADYDNPSISMGGRQWRGNP